VFVKINMILINETHAVVQGSFYDNIKVCIHTHFFWCNIKNRNDENQNVKIRSSNNKPNILSKHN
jgi:hypothetical protein